MDSTPTSVASNNNSNKTNTLVASTYIPPTTNNSNNNSSSNTEIKQTLQQIKEIEKEQQRQQEQEEEEEEKKQNEINQNNKLKQKLIKINNLAKPKRDELYWSWSLKEYIRLGHIKSIFRILKILDHQTPYIYNEFDMTDQPKTEIIQNQPHQPHNKGYNYYFHSKLIIDPRRASFPYLYMPNLLRQKGDILLCLNSKLLSISNILHTLSTGNIDSLLLPNFLPIPKSLPVVPFLLIIIYFKLCLSKGDNAKSIIDSLLECRNKINLLPPYEDKAIPPIDVLLDNIMHITLRFIDWTPTNTAQLIPTEVYFNEIFEVIYLTGREFLELSQQQQIQQQPSTSSSSILSSLTIATDEHRFRLIDIYLKDSRKLVYLNITSLAQKRGTMKLSIWSKDNINTLLKCCRFYLQVNNSLNSINSNSNIIVPNNQSEEVSTLDDTILILDCCMRLAFSWATICSGILPSSLEKYSDLGQCWWNTSPPSELQNILREWISTIKLIFKDVKKSSKNSDKLHLVCLVWLASTISLFDEEEQKEGEEDSYKIYIKNINNHPELLTDFTKSSLIITSIGFALIGVQTIEQSIELIQRLVNLWGNTVIGNSSNIMVPSIENVCLIFKTIQNVITTKFKIDNFNNQTELLIALITWLRCITDELYNLFYSSNLNSRFLCIFIGSSIIHSINRNKSIISILKDDQDQVKNEIIGKIQELFYTLINQHNFLPKSFKIGLATAYSLSSIDKSFGQEKQVNQSILMIILDVLLDEILCINGSLGNWLEKPNEINSMVIKKIESHKSTPLFLSIPPFIQTISSLILSLHDNDNNKLVLLKLCDFTYNLNEKWLNYSNVKTPNDATIFPKSMIRKTLDPTFQAIFQSLSLLFFDISSILTPMDSVIGIELFCKLTFLGSDDDINQSSIPKSIRALSKNVLLSECAIIRLIDKMPLYYQVSKDDKVQCLQVVIYFHALDCLITSVPHNLIVDHIVPNLFEYMEYPNSKLNQQSHSILAKMFAIPNFHLSIKMVPMYLKSALKTFPKFTKVSSLYEVLVSIIENNAPTNPIVLYSIKTISQSAIEHMSTNSSNTVTSSVNNSNSNNNQDSKIEDSSNLINHTHKKLKNSNKQQLIQQQELNIAAKGLIKVLFSLFLYIDIQIIDLVLDEIRKVIIKAPTQKIRLELCSELLTEITGNLENNTKKNICIGWYLTFIHEIENLNRPNLINQSLVLNNNNNNNQQQQKPQTQLNNDNNSNSNISSNNKQ